MTNGVNGAIYNTLALSGTPGFATPISLVEGAPATASDTASPGALCRRGNQDTNTAAADWTLCAAATPGQANPP